MNIQNIPPLAAIVAMTPNRAIGLNGDIPWHLSEDLKHFKTLTLGHPIIMGRKTWDSLPKRPLPGRINIVVSRNQNFEANGAVVAHSLLEAIQLCPHDSEPIIIGGGAIYKEALPLCSRLFVTEVLAPDQNADTFFPEIDNREWTPSESSEWLTAANSLKYRFIDYSRKTTQL